MTKKSHSPSITIDRVRFSNAMKSVITNEIQFSIEDCVLCWLAMVSKNGTPNVSPKEA